MERDVSLRLLVNYFVSRINGDIRPVIFMLVVDALNFVQKLDIPKQGGGGNLSAINRFKMLDSRGADSVETKIDTLHQNAIR